VCAVPKNGTEFTNHWLNDSFIKLSPLCCLISTKEEELEDGFLIDGNSDEDLEGDCATFTSASNYPSTGACWKK